MSDVGDAELDKLAFLRARAWAAQRPFVPYDSMFPPVMPLSEIVDVDARGVAEEDQ